MHFIISLAGFALLALAGGEAHAGRPMTRGTTSAGTVERFRATEQSLLDAITSGNKAPWDRAMDPSCVVTSEEGQTLTKQQFLDELAPLPKGLTGGITVKDLTVREWPALAVVRYLADEWESVFGQKLATRYRITNTYRRDGARWRMVAAHLSVVTRDPPAQVVSTVDWPKFAGTYRLEPDGWTFAVEFRGGKLYGGRDVRKLRPFVPVTPNVFVISGTLGEWIFVLEKGRATRIVNLRKFQPLVWTRVHAPNHDLRRGPASEWQGSQPAP